METLLKSLGDLDAVIARFIDETTAGATVGLSGELGAGKTTFVRHLIGELCRRAGKTPPRVTSPTFVLHQSYPDLPRTVDHFDLYRLEGAGSPALVEIGYFEALERRRSGRGYLFVEWPEKVTDLSLLQLDSHLRLEFRGSDRILKGT